MFQARKVAAIIASRLLTTPLNKVPSFTSKNVSQWQLLTEHHTLLRQTTLRTMSSDSNVNLQYEDIVNLSSKNEIILIDVREPAEIQETGKLPGSTHIPLGDIPAALALSDAEFKEKYGIEKPQSESPLVFSCRSGKRSQMALNKALELGFKRSRHYGGGWLDWESHTKN